MALPWLCGCNLDGLSISSLIRMNQLLLHRTEPQSSKFQYLKIPSELWQHSSFFSSLSQSLVKVPDPSGLWSLLKLPDPSRCGDSLELPDLSGCEASYLSLKLLRSWLYSTEKAYRSAGVRATRVPIDLSNCQRRRCSKKCKRMMLKWWV